jgi:hypothetical protein
VPDPVEVIARALFRADVRGTDFSPDDEEYHWHEWEYEARAALAALEAEGYVTELRGDIEQRLNDAWQRGHDEREFPDALKVVLRGDHRGM